MREKHLTEDNHFQFLRNRCSHHCRRKEVPWSGGGGGTFVGSYVATCNGRSLGNGMSSYEHLF